MLDKIIIQVKDAIIASVKGADDIVEALRSAVKSQLIGVLENVAAIGVAVEDAIAAVAEGAVRASSGILLSITDGVRNTVHAALEGIGATGVDALLAVRHVARGAVWRVNLGEKRAAI